MFALGVFSRRRAGRLWFLANFPSLFPRIAYFSFYTSMYPLSNVHMWVRFFRTDTCPISPYPEWLGVVVKAEEYGSVRCRVLNGSKGSFPFVLGRYTIQRTLLHWPRYFRCFPNCSYTAFALLSRETSDMPRTESSLAVSQDYLDFYYLSSAITFLDLGLGPQCKNGSGPQIIGPHNYNITFLRILLDYW